MICHQGGLFLSDFADSFQIIYRVDDSFFAGFPNVAANLGFYTHLHF